jgi:hypothetical protein
LKVAIVGSREFSDWTVIKNFIDTLDPDVDWIVSGGARGVDDCAHLYGKEKGFAVLNFYPNRKKYGNAGYHIRNQKIAEEADLIVAFWDGQSSGTKSTIEKARALFKPVKIILEGTNPSELLK